MNNKATPRLILLFFLLIMTAAAVAQASTTGPLRLLSITPGGTDVPPGQEIVFQFNHTMVALGNMGRAGNSLPIHITPKLNCQWRWLDTDKLACRLPGTQHFRPATRYTIRVGTGFTAKDGARLQKAVTHTFTTIVPDVNWANFQHWSSPVTPSYLVRFNLPVTAAAVAKSVTFAPVDGGAATLAQAKPFNKKRSGPLLLPVPGVPGALAWISKPKPNKPEDAGKAAGVPRKVWVLTPAHPLRPSTHYEIVLKPGLMTPYGTLPGAGGAVDDTGFTTFGPFKFLGTHCGEYGGGLTGELAGMIRKFSSKLSSKVAAGLACRPNSVQLSFSAPVPLATLSAVHWDPSPVSAAKFKKAWSNYPRWQLENNSASGGSQSYQFGLPFELVPMHKYTIHVPAGVTDQFGRKLATAATAKVMTGHLASDISAGSTEAVLEAGQDTVLPLSFTNLASMDFSYDTLNAAQLTKKAAASPGSIDISLFARFGGKPPADRRLAEPLGVRKFLHGEPGVVSGLLSWTPTSAGSMTSPSRIVAQVTPWEAMAKIGHFDTLVWLTSLSTGKPVANVTVRFYQAPTGHIGDITPASVTAVTDANGMAVLPGATALGKSWENRDNQGAPDWYLGATRGKAMALLPLTWDYLRDIGDASGYSISSNIQPPHGHTRTWAVTAQGVYRPGATVHYAVFVRGMAADKLVNAPALKYTLKVSDSTGKNVQTLKDVHLSPFGGLSGSIFIPKNAATGWYDMSLSWPSDNGTQTSQVGNFLVTEFVPSSFKVSTLLQGGLFGPGDPVDAQAQARLHAGGPYTQAPVRFNVQVKEEPFAPTTPVASGFSFDVNPDDAPDSLTFYQTKKKLDNAGNARVHTRLPDKAAIVYGRLVVQSAVKSERGSWVAGRAGAVWATRDRFVGLKLDDWLLQANKPFDVQYLVVDAKGDTKAGSHVHIRLERQKINVVNTANGTGGFTPQQKTTWVKEGQCAATSTKAPGKCRLTPAHAGTYRIVASVVDTHGKSQQTTLDAWSVGPGGVVWQTGAHLNLVPDKNSYHVGDTARVLVQNPYPGARALVTVERYGVLWKKVVTLATGTPVLRIPIQRSFFPGAYLSVSIFSPRVAKASGADLGKPTLAVGYVALPVAGKGSSLQVTVTPARTDYKPRQTVDVNVDVKNANGEGAKDARLMVAVVDESVLDLLKGGSTYYDPRKSFYAPPGGPDMLNYSLVSQLVTTRRAELAAPGKGITPGGGGGGGLPVRSVFKYTAYWKPDLETDGNGHAHFSFKLPDNLTGWRVLVMGLTPGSAMGLGQATVHSNLPLQLGPALPNGVRAGDRFAAGFSLTNRTKNKVAANVTIAAQGAASGKASQQLKLAPYEHGLAWLKLKPDLPGTIKLLASARAGALGDAMTKSIPVRPAGTAEAAASYGSLTASSATVPIELPKNALAGSGRLTVNLSPTQLANLAAAFTDMRDDPLDTWEVHLSRAVMASDYLALKAALPDSLRWPKAGKEIGDILQHAADYQAPNGGMAFLIPRNDFVSPYLSVYTALAFNWLAKAGHPVPQDVRSALDNYLLSQIVSKSNAGDSPQVALILRVAALDALAGDSGVSANAAAGLLPKLPKLGLFGKALLLHLALSNHDATSARQIITSILAQSEQTGGSISFQQTEADAYSSILASPLRSNCVVLDSLVAAVKAGGPEAQVIGDVPARLLRWIDARRGTGGSWPNSQENVFCTTAEAHYAQAFEGPVNDLMGTASVGGQAFGKARFASRRTPPKSLSTAAPTRPASVVVKHGGEGRLYYAVHLGYTVPASTAKPVDAGFTVKRVYQVKRHGDWTRVGPTTVLRRGDIVRVSLTVDVPAERHHVVLTDPLPGAFEAVNHQLANSDQTTPQKTPDSTTLWFDYGAWPNYSIVTSGFYHRETALDAVRFYADILPAGHYHIIYAAQVISPGRFIALPAKAREIYQPDVFGRGSAMTVHVAMPPARDGGGK